MDDRPAATGGDTPDPNGATWGKIAVFTDVHGNAAALRAVLNELEGEEDLVRAFSLGDMISIGPDTNEVLELLFSQPDLTLIAGNHEEYVLALLEDRDPGLEGDELSHLKWIARHIDRKFVPRLKRLPKRIETEIGSRRMLMIHYHIEEGAFARIEWAPDLNSLEERYQGTRADVVCFGHHHPPHLFYGRNRVYLNPGSMGCCERPVARYAVIDLDREPAAIDLREASYDNRDFLRSYRRLDVPASDFILSVFHGDQDPDS